MHNFKIKYQIYVVKIIQLPAFFRVEKLYGEFYQQPKYLICRKKQRRHLLFSYLLPLIFQFIKIEGDIAAYINPRKRTSKLWLRLLSTYMKSLNTKSYASPFLNSHWTLSLRVEPFVLKSRY